MTPTEVLQAENEALRKSVDILAKRARAWKALARLERRRTYIAKDFAESWYQGYRRAWKLDEPSEVSATLTELAQHLGQFIKRRLFFWKALP